MTNKTYHPSANWQKTKRVSFFVAGTFIVVLATVFLAVQYGPTMSSAPTALRRVFHFNEWVSRKFFSNNHLAPLPRSNPAGKKARVNGLLGLAEPVDLENYRISVESGTVHLELPIKAITRLAKVQDVIDFKCIEGWSQTMGFAGTRFSDFMATYNLGKKIDGSLYDYVGLETPDGAYYVSIDMMSMLHPQTLLAYEMNGTPLTDDHGAPLRLAIPVKYGIKNLKRIGKIVFSDTRPRDYWAEHGYDWYSGL